MDHRLLLGLAAAALAVAPALAQSGGSGGSGSGMPSGDVATAATQATDALASAAADKLLVKDMLGAEVTGPGGDAVGTVENLVVLPGGRVVAALISTKDQSVGRIAVPFSTVKLSTSGGKVGVSLPMGISELKGNKQIQALTRSVQGMTSDDSG